MGEIAPGGTVLDLACGNGRHTRALLAAGFAVCAVDRDTDGLADLASQERLEILAGDLEGAAAWPLAGRQFDGIVVANYLHRPLFPYLIAALAPGGLLIYETFAVGNERFGRPANPAFLLREGELSQVFGPDLHILAYEHGEEAEPRPAMRQRIAARKPMS